MKAQNRDSNIELLRIVLMSLIVFGHLLVHGIGLATIDVYEDGSLAENIPFFYILAATMTCFSVNCFIFISGYYGIKTNKEKVLILLLQLLFYSILTYLAKLYIENDNNFLNYVHWNSWKYLFPASDCGWWFINGYLFLLFVAPILNEGVANIPRKTLLTILLVLFFIQISGARYYAEGVIDTGLFFIFIGKVLQTLSFSFFETYRYFIFIISIVVLCLIQYYYYSCSMSNSNFLYVLSNSNPFNVIAAVSLFSIFRNLIIRSNIIINTIATGTLAVYLITDGYLRQFFNKIVIATIPSGQAASGMHLIALLAFSLIFVCFVSLVEVLRAKAFLFFTPS